ncbi:BglG family transcription antiterminator [Gottfriedia acidiceleris]|uniref:BglG family transcription antiterminator n=1 Tax=Gottfriedia acidiceleris TaxID=371036 RepID=UPI000B453F61|nr:helix-turn-helix domain-containing protein [Gottfriedia acidiceleris]
MDKSTKRKLQIIDILSKQDKWFKTEELASELLCTEKTIRNDLQAINTHLPKGWQIETIKGKGIYINKPISSSINQIRSLYVKNSLKFQAIMLIQFKQIKSISELANALFTQQPAVYSILDRVEELLVAYHLTLKRGPLEIVGREFEIRLLCGDILDALCAYSDDQEWPLEAFSFRDIKKIVLDTTEKFKLFLYPSTTNKYVYLLGTMLYRIDKKMQLELTEQSIKKIVESKYYKIANEICNQLEHQYKHHISMNERIAFSLLISTLPYYSFDNMEKNEFLYLYKNQKTRYFKELFHLVKLLKEKTDISLDEDEEFLYTLHDQFQRYSFILYSIDKKEPSYSMDRYVKNEYSDLYKKVSKALQTWTKKYSYPEITRDKIAKVALNVQASKINFSSSKKRVLLLTSNGPGVHRYIETKLITAFGHKIEFILPKLGDFESTIINELNIEFIISDFLLEGEIIHPVITIDPVLTQRDIDQISNFLSNTT